LKLADFFSAYINYSMKSQISVKGY